VLKLNHLSINRRRFLIAAAVAALHPASIFANQFSLDKNKIQKKDWISFEKNIKNLANSIGLNENNTIINQGLHYLKELDTDSVDFKHAVTESYETGNHYWLWQRMIKEQNINGGILTINNSQLVQLHNHPGATGLVRIIKGEAEVWQYDEIDNNNHSSTEEKSIAKLNLTSHRILKPGDMAVLTPTKGNIHALKSISKQCSMLDFFIPPYKRSQRSWYEPLTPNWFNKKQITCNKIPQHEFTMA